MSQVDQLAEIKETISSHRLHLAFHRPIWRLPLNALHVSATEALRWISPDLQEMTTTLDRFPQVMTLGIRPYEDRVADFLASRGK